MTGPTSSHSVVRKVIVSEILIFLLVGVSVATFAHFYSNKPEVEQKTAETTRLNVDVFEVQQVDFQELLTGFGTVRADREVLVTAQVSGEIIEIHPQLKVGYPVNAENVTVTENGPSSLHPADALLKIDQRDYREQVQQSESRIQESITEIDRLKDQKKNVARQLKTAESVLATLKEEFDRVRNGLEKRVSTPSELNRALLEVQRYEDTIIQLESQTDALPHQIRAAEQRLAAATSEKVRAENDLQRTEVAPPFDGVLSEVFVEQGQFVRTGEQLVRLTDLTKVEIPIALRFEDHLQLEGILNDGTRPIVALATNETASAQWTGRLVRLAPEADAQSRTVQAFVEVENLSDTPALLPGAFVHARIDGIEHAKAVLIPREAVFNGSVYVVDKDNIARRRKIRTGKRFQSLVLLEDGLNAGERVILTNLDIVEEGQEVVIQTTTSPHDEVANIRSPVIRLKTRAQ